MNSLTNRQAQVLIYIAECTRKLLPPTCREICKELGITSTNAVSKHLGALEKKGWITREFRKARCISLTEKAKGVECLRQTQF